MDHWFQMEVFAPVTEPMLEGYTTLGFMAALTATVTLGLFVTGVTYRHPGCWPRPSRRSTSFRAVVRNSASARVVRARTRGLGVPFPPVAERFERLEETLQICLQMWSDDDGPFEGRHYQLAETICEPRPISRRDRR